MGGYYCVPVEWLLGTAPCVRKLLLVKLEVKIGRYLAMFEGTEKQRSRRENSFPCLCQTEHGGQYTGLVHTVLGVPVATKVQVVTSSA